MATDLGDAIRAVPGRVCAPRTHPRQAGSAEKSRAKASEDLKIQGEIDPLALQVGMRIGHLTQAIAPIEFCVEPGVRRPEQPVVAETRLILAEKSHTTLFFPASGEAFDLFGPGEFLVGNQEVRAIGVAAPTVKRQLNAAFRAIRIDRTDLAQAAIVMRGADEGEQPELLAPEVIVPTR